MPTKSRRERLRAVERRLSSGRLIDALLVVQAPDGREIIRTGGLWDSTAKRYTKVRPAVPCIVRLKHSQTEADANTGLSLADGCARWLDKMRAGVDEGRPIVIMAEGNRGSGKTWFLGTLMALVCALEWPGRAQFSINLLARNKREICEQMAGLLPPTWGTREVKDPRDPYLEFFNGSKIFWRTGRAPAALREGGISFVYGFINEGQAQTSDVGLNAVGAIRNIGSLVGIATNPDPDGGWMADLKEGLEAGTEHDGEVYKLRAELNDAINQATQPKIGRVLRYIDKDAADADALGLWRRRGAAYPAFTTKPRRLDDATGRWAEGHVGKPPTVEVGRPLWRDVTREETARIFGGVGFDFVGGSDFQHNPGCCAAIAKLYRDELGLLLLNIVRFIGAPGDERALAQALEDAGYVPGDVDFEGRPVAGRSLVLVGDGTGDIQDATHRRGTPYSFKQMTNYGWKVFPPMRHRSGSPCNPLVADSLKQMDTLLRSGALLFDPACMDAASEFPSLTEGFKKSLLNSSGKFVKKGHFTHGPDGVRYLAWRFMDRNRPAPVPVKPDLSIFSATKGKSFSKG